MTICGKCPEFFTKHEARQYITGSPLHSVEFGLILRSHCAMPAPNPFHTIGTIPAPASPRTYCTLLANSKEILSQFSLRQAAAPGPLEPQTRVDPVMATF